MKTKPKKRNPMAVIVNNEFHKPKVIQKKKGSGAKGVKYKRKEKHKKSVLDIFLKLLGL